MHNIGPETRLTDALERQLMAQAIEEQMRFKPGKALKALFANVATKLRGADRSIAGKPTHAAS